MACCRRTPPRPEGTLPVRTTPPSPRYQTLTVCLPLLGEDSSACLGLLTSVTLGCLLRCDPAGELPRWGSLHGSN